jgi:folate-binding protein YgfZ
MERDTRTRGETSARERTVADLSDWRVIAVSGSEGHGWLDDLVTADLRGLERGQARRSLLLTPTGAVLASFTVTPWEDGLLLLQDGAEPRAIDGLLARFVLSSDVRLEDVTGRYAVLAFPSETAPRTAAEGIAPSPFGTGWMVLGPIAERERLASIDGGSARPIEGDELEAWRIEAGVVRVGVDTAETSLPEEAGLLDAVAFDKGCFLGQESVARVRNTGHPRHLVVTLESDDALMAGEPLLAEGEAAGEVTSAVRREATTYAVARVAWDRRDAELSSARGVVVRRRD